MSPAEQRRAGGAGAGRRVVIDALAARFGGTAYAAVHLAKELAQRQEVASVTVVGRRDSIVERELAMEDGITCVSLPVRSRFELLRRAAWETLRLPGIVERERCDAMISMSGMLPRLPGCRLICLLFNPVMYEHNGAANSVRRWAVRRTARNADYVAAPSQYMADLASASIERDCAVVPLGVDHRVFAPLDNAGDQILYVADFYAHKRHDLLLDAWLLLPAPRPVLRLVGDHKVDPNAYAALLSRIQTLADRGSIVLEHEIAVDRLVSAYHRARVFVMPSERESFGMPIVESMACGVPTIVRGLPSLRETGGAGARYVDGNEPAEWSAVMQRLVQDQVEHDRAKHAALEAAARFSWAAFADGLAAHL